MKIQADAIIFDIDGVLVDDSQSYYLAIEKTVNYLLAKRGLAAKTIQKDIALIKKLPGFNNDWDTAFVLFRLILGKIPKKNWPEKAKKMMPVNRKKPLFRWGFNVFQTFYLGSNIYSRIYKRKAPFNQKNNLINNEPLIIKKQTLKKLKRMGCKLAIVTGRPRFEAAYVLRKNNLIPTFFSKDSLVALEDVQKEKPNPEPLLKAKKILKAKNPIYLGDTINDVLAAKNAGIASVYVGNEKLGDYQIKNVNQILKLLR